MILPLDRSKEREEMVRVQIASRGVADPGVLTAMRDVPRHLFVPENLKGAAYDDRPLPIGHEQTISQPYIVAVMTELLKLKSNSRVLEIGTGSGYQAAILSLLAEEVVTIERISEVADSAGNLLQKLGFTNITVVTGDGTLGYFPRAQYDAILVTAGAPSLSCALIQQLSDYARIVAPIGGRDVQELVVIEKKDGVIREFRHGAVCFVPLIGRYGWGGIEGCYHGDPSKQ